MRSLVRASIWRIDVVSTGGAPVIGTSLPSQPAVYSLRELVPSEMTVTFTTCRPSGTCSYVTVMLLGAGPGLNFERWAFMTQVPTRGSGGLGPAVKEAQERVVSRIVRSESAVQERTNQRRWVPWNMETSSSDVYLEVKANPDERSRAMVRRENRGNPQGPSVPDM